MATSPAFTLFTLNGVDAQKFLQGQVTLNVEILAENLTRYTAICSLKGRIQFGIWLKKLIRKALKLSALKIRQQNWPAILKVWRFFKMKLEQVGPVYPVINDIQTDF